MKKISFYALALCLLVVPCSCGDDEEETDTLSNPTDQSTGDDSEEEEDNVFTLQFQGRTVFYTDEIATIYFAGNKTIADNSTLIKTVIDGDGNVVVENDAFTYCGKGYTFKTPSKSGSKYYVCFTDANNEKIISQSFCCMTHKNDVTFTITPTTNYFSFETKKAYTQEEAEANPELINLVVEGTVFRSTSTCENEVIKAGGTAITFNENETEISNAGTTAFFMDKSGHIYGLITIDNITFVDNNKWSSITFTYGGEAF